MTACPVTCGLLLKIMSGQNGDINDSFVSARLRINVGPYVINVGMRAISQVLAQVQFRWVTFVGGHSFQVIKDT